ncbi:MAG: hypothetical protein ACRCX2_25020, partial [Paraclostridium sp.]
MSEVAYQIQRKVGGIVNSGQKVIFQTPQLIDLGFGIFYNQWTGMFTVHKEGLYYISWWVAIQQTTLLGASFAIKTSDGKTIKGNSNDGTGEISGDAIIKVQSTPYYFYLENMKGVVTYSGVSSEVANLSIIKIEEGIGITGATGPQGLLGPTGLQGDTGATGPQGLQG